MTKGDYEYEAAYQYHFCYDDGDVHVLHAHDLLRLSFRCILRIKSGPLYRLSRGGITVTFNRETSHRSFPVYFFERQVIPMAYYFEKLVRENFRFGRMCPCHHQ